MKQRIQFVIDVEDGTYTMTELCQAYGVSRKTGYKWLGRYEPGNPDSLRNRSRAPHSHPPGVQ